MAKKGKKLSLEEARALFSVNNTKSSTKSNTSQYENYTPKNPKIDQRITQLERQIMEGNLSVEKEEEILNEIGRLERQKH